MKFTGTFTRQFIGKVSPKTDKAIFKAISDSALSGMPKNMATDSISYFLAQVQLSGYKNVHPYLLEDGIFEVIGWTGDLSDGIDWMVNVRVLSA